MVTILNNEWADKNLRNPQPEFLEEVCKYTKPSLGPFRTLQALHKTLKLGLEILSQRGSLVLTEVVEWKKNLGMVIGGAAVSRMIWIAAGTVKFFSKLKIEDVGLPEKPFETLTTVFKNALETVLACSYCVTFFREIPFVCRYVPGLDLLNESIDLTKAVANYRKTSELEAKATSDGVKKALGDSKFCHLLSIAKIVGTIALGVLGLYSATITGTPLIGELLSSLIVTVIAISRDLFEATMPYPVLSGNIELG